MDIEAKIDYKDLKKQKNINRKQFKKAIKNKDYDMIQQCLVFVKKYDEMVRTEKYEKYFNMMSNEVKEIINLRNHINELKDFDTSIYEIFEEKLIKRMSQHINRYTEKRLGEMKKALVEAQKQIVLRKTRRTPALKRQKQTA